MMNTNPIFSLKNFRSFGEDGADFELAPITVLTGCNSAGKSSMTKALLLLNKLDNSGKTVLPALKLYTKDLGLGSFEKTLHKQTKSNEFIFSYRMWSDYLQEEVIVKKIFQTKEDDVLKDGYLCKYTIEKNDGTIIKDEEPYPGLMPKDNKESILKNYNNYCLASDYLRFIKLRAILNVRNDSDNERINKYKIEYENHIQKYEDIKRCLKENKINVESYKIGPLDKWTIWLSKHNKELEGYTEELKKDLEVLLPNSSPIGHFIELFSNEVLYPWFTKKVEYIDSASATIKRVYPVEDGSKMGVALRKFNSRKFYIKELQIDDDLPSGYFVNRWLSEDRFNLGKISIEGNDEGGMKVYLINNDEKRLLADEGYGITQLVSLLLLIDNTITNVKEELKVLWCNGEPDNKQMSFSRPAQVICVEEPENHLHPQYQSLLAEMFVEAYQKYNIHFIIETHSEYLIRKLQVMVADKENALTSNDVSLNYVEKNENGVSYNRQIRIKEDGRLDGSFGAGFYDEAGGLSRQLFMLNK